MRVGDKVVWFQNNCNRTKKHHKKIIGIVTEVKSVRVKVELENYGTRWVMQENVQRVG